MNKRNNELKQKSYTYKEYLKTFLPKTASKEAHTIETASDFGDKLANETLSRLRQALLDTEPVELDD